MTLVLQWWEIFRREVRRGKTPAQDVKTLGVDPCCLELIENRNYPPALTSRLSWAGSQVFSRKQYVTVRVWCGDPCAHTHKHAPKNWSEWTNISAAVNAPHSPHPFIFQRRLAPRSTTVSPPWEPDRKLRYDFHICYSVTDSLSLNLNYPLVAQDKQ